MTMGLINPNVYTASTGVQVANTYVKLGQERVIFQVNRPQGATDNAVAYAAGTDMVIWKDADAFTGGLDPIARQWVQYPVPDANAVYGLLYAGAVATQGWGNAYQFSASGSTDTSSAVANSIS